MPQSTLIHFSYKNLKEKSPDSETPGREKAVILKHAKRIRCNLASCTFKISKKLIEFESTSLIKTSISSFPGLNCIKMSQKYPKRQNHSNFQF
jgi:hypothetical protein